MWKPRLVRGAGGVEGLDEDAVVVGASDDDGDLAWGLRRRRCRTHPCRVSGQLIVLVLGKLPGQEMDEPAPTTTYPGGIGETRARYPWRRG